jgi:hypothetical protein
MERAQQEKRKEIAHSLFSEAFALPAGSYRPENK